ncbi:hypothetical protein [Pseudophaeobacter leonis]|jgi:predicted DNA-binding transcriptional regulator AlpA|uniref:hypothetical protein n=1 Tax=Pseudophaeobacter leonis TaxID=1144477 RepID=UPI0009F643BC|nr:hypothetical protein [Pseudophaeobacter leonis]
MTNANLNISVVEKRMLKQAEAASYTGLSSKHFKLSCPVQPIEMRPGTVLWDKRDLDSWIDSMKNGAELTTQAAILDRL